MRGRRRLEARGEIAVCLRLAPELRATSHATYSYIGTPCTATLHFSYIFLPYNIFKVTYISITFILIMISGVRWVSCVLKAFASAFTDAIFYSAAAVHFGTRFAARTKKTITKTSNWFRSARPLAKQNEKVLRRRVVRGAPRGPTASDGPMITACSYIM